MNDLLSSPHPTVAELERELRRVKYRRSYRRVLKSTIFTLITVAAVAVLIAMLWMPVLRIYGASMAPVLEDGEIVIIAKGAQFEQGDVIAFYYNNKILIKRVIAFAGEWVNIDENGNVSVNDRPLEEPYLTEKARGNVNIDLPYQVPDGTLFVMGDHRLTSADSRNTAVGCVTQDQLVGKVLLRVWPFDRIGLIR